MKTKNLCKKVLSMLLVGTLVISGCGAESADDKSDSNGGDSTQGESADVEVIDFADMDMSKWMYESDADVYYQVGQTYCEKPVDTTYETLGYYVPGGYFDATDNGDGTYTCTVNTDTKVREYTSLTAPIVIPVETPGYSAMSAPTGYTDVTAYTSQGFVYLYAGCRGREHGAPAGVTDLKAAIRYIRAQGDVLPGNKESIYSFGMSGGGAQSALLGATGDSELYTPYLELIGAVSDQSDAVAGSMCWCPITNLDSADAAYEWNMSASRSNLSDEEQSISDELADAYADYINNAGLKDESGNILTLTDSSEGRMQAGTYYDYVVEQVEKSINNFLADTTFPYDSDSANQGGNFGGGGFGDRGGFGNKDDSDGDFGDRGDFKGPDGKKDFEDLSEEEKEQIEERMGNRGGAPDGDFGDNISRTDSSSAVTISGTYESAKDYIDALNSEFNWVTYDENTNTAKITGLSDFSKAVKPVSKSLGAFDQLDRSQGENVLFGYADGEGAHFDTVLAEIVGGTDYESDFKDDLSKTDSVGNTVDKRLQMYSPLYYLLDSSDGYESSTVANNWRIRTGAWQSDTSITTEINLYLGLINYSSDISVDFETVWGAGHVQAERTGEAAENFISWVKECVA